MSAAEERAAHNSMSADDTASAVREGCGVRMIFPFSGLAAGF